MLDTLANVKTFMGISDSTYDTELNQIMGYVDQMIKSYVGYDIEEAAITDEVHSTDGETEAFTVDYPPIVSGFVVKYDGETIESTNYEVDNSTGIVRMFYTPTRSLNKFTFSYTGGYSTTPEDLKYVFCSLTRDVFNNRKRGSDVKSERLGDYSITYKGDSEVIQEGIVGPYRATLDKYAIYDF